MMRIVIYKGTYSDSCFYRVKGTGPSERQEALDAIFNLDPSLVFEVPQNPADEFFRKLGVWYWLVPEPTNKVDSNAVAVWAAGDKRRWNGEIDIHVGYIHADDAAYMTHQLAAPMLVPGTIVIKKGTYGVKLDRQVLEDSGLLPPS